MFCGWFNLLCLLGFVLLGEFASSVGLFRTQDTQNAQVTGMHHPAPQYTRPWCWEVLILEVNRAGLKEEENVRSSGLFKRFQQSQSPLLLPLLYVLASLQIAI